MNILLSLVIGLVIGFVVIALTLDLPGKILLLRALRRQRRRNP